jgi:hypothetical protein
VWILGGSDSRAARGIVLFQFPSRNATPVTRT